uniref:F5/8 type C domain-containing protein n=1 Tax=Micromonas commoda virus TaxID=3057169 RepID=A0AAU7YP55_9PHYC
MSLEQTIDNLQIRNANMVTFVGTSNTMVDTTTGRIQTKGIQHNSNVITDVSGPHGRGVATLKKYPEIDFDASKLDRNDSTNTYVQAGYTVTASTGYHGGTTSLQPWKVHTGIKGGHDFYSSETAANQGGTAGFIGTSNTYVGNSTLGGISGEWVKTRFPFPVKIKHVDVTVRDSSYAAFDWQSPSTFYIIGSHDGTTWSSALGTVTDRQYTASDLTERVILTNNEYYKYYAVVVTKVSGDRDVVSIDEIEYYGYEEDPPAGDHSVDTTFKSRFNNPQTTGVQVLVDGATGVGTNQISGGPDPSGNQSTYDSTGKYWTLNGTLTSNLSVEANTFLEGDQPHAVSVWFNSSNLEANVSNTCVFSIASEEKLDSVNLDLQSNTWHNLTYAYQGEGGSRVTYLDGRKVSEDQAEDTFGDYPPFAMTGYSQGGYVASASTEYTGYEAWEAFDDITGSGTNYWSGSQAKYATSGDYGFLTGNAVDPYLTTVSGIIYNGDWIQLEMPHKLVLDYVTWFPRQTDRFPRQGVFAGSNDGVNWDAIHIFSGLSVSAETNTPIITNSENNKTAYKYIRVVITHLNGNGYSAADNIKLYGHRENDLVRLPDPTNVLKYPHIIINEPAKRGYVVSSSTEAIPPHTSGSYQAYNIFDGELVFDGGTSNTPPNGTAWISLSSKYDSSGNPTGTAASTNVTGQSPVATPGEWFQLELPHKVKLSSIRVMGQTNNTTELAGRSPVDAVLAGSNNGTTWTTVLTYTGASWTTLSEFKSFPANVDSTNAYKYFRFITTKTGGDQYAAIQEFEFYGTGVDSIPIQIGGGNIDKVANFRVYDKFIEEDQVNEIWNAQKEEFGRAKPQMVLQQGKLGIGTDAPQGSLSVADEPHNVEEFPPRALSDDKTYIEGHGEFCTNASNTYQTGDYESYKAFNKNSTGGTYTWWSQSDIASVPTYSTSTGEFSSTDSSYSTNVEGATKMGHWLQIEFPYKINYRYSDIQGAHHSIGRQPRAGYILGSNDLTGVWTSLHNFTNVTRTHAYESVRYTPPTVSTQTFKYFRLVIEEQGNYQYAGIARWDIFGTREQGQSVLHDGQLTLTKNLDVPRIGPPLDADDTPRRDRLVVEYNTSSNPTFEGAVRDTSGRGNDGMFRGGAFYSDAEKALVFDGNADYVESPPLGWSGAQQHSVSVWIKLDLMTNPHSTSIQNAWTIVNGGATNRVSHLHIFTNGTIEWAFNGNNATTGSGFIQAGTWYHVVCVYNGGAGNDASSRRMWINGDEKSWNSLGSSSTLNLEPEATFALGYNKQLNNYDHDGSVSNAKLYDVALTSEDVKTLYDMGRMGGKANPQPLHISGPVNVMGDIRYITSRPLALPTMWDHMANGNCAKGVYPIVGRNGGNTIYHVYCEPDWAGGGWMCMAQFTKDGYQVKAHPTNGDLNIFTKSLGDSKNIRWDNTFAVPLNILSLDGNGYDLDVMIVVLGGGYAGRYEGGMRVGSIWRGHQLSVAFNPGTSSYPGASGLASSSDGYSFTTRTPVTNQNYDMRNSGGWYYSCAANANYQGSYTDQGLSDGGYILHQGSANKVGSIYGAYHSDTGVAYNSQGNTDFACVRIFVRPSVY